MCISLSEMEGKRTRFAWQVEWSDKKLRGKCAAFPFAVVCMREHAQTHHIRRWFMSAVKAESTLSEKAHSAFGFFDLAFAFDLAFGSASLAGSPLSSPFSPSLSFFLRLLALSLRM